MNDRVGDYVKMCTRVISMVSMVLMGLLVLFVVGHIVQQSSHLSVVEFCHPQQLAKLDTKVQDLYQPELKNAIVLMQVNVLSLDTLPRSTAFGAVNYIVQYCYCTFTSLIHIVKPLIDIATTFISTRTFCAIRQFFRSV
jgi:hypothetical protein